MGWMMVVFFFLKDEGRVGVMCKSFFNKSGVFFCELYQCF